MVFSKNIKSDFAFDFGGVSIAPVDTHKHLGVTFRSDSKWNNHVDILLEKTSKQVNAFRKLKFQLKSVYFEKISLTYIRPILEYLPGVWVSCGQINSNRLEKNSNRNGTYSYRITFLC